jgi:hypothetical protein
MEGRLASFHLSRSKIERMVKAKYLSWPIEEPETVLLKTMDVEELSRVPRAATPAEAGCETLTLENAVRYLGEELDEVLEMSGHDVERCKMIARVEE